MDEDTRILVLDRGRLRERPWNAAWHRCPGAYLAGLAMVLVGCVLVLVSEAHVADPGAFVPTVALAGGIAVVGLVHHAMRDGLDRRGTQEAWVQDGCLVYSYHAPGTARVARTVTCVDLRSPWVTVARDPGTMTVTVVGPTVSIETVAGATDVQFDVLDAPFDETLIPDCFLPSVAEVVAEAAGVEIQEMAREGSHNGTD